jgi:protoheme IX farnesyltransferase
MNQLITIAAIFVFAVQVLFVINFFYSIWYGKKQTTSQPMGCYYPGMDYANPCRDTVTGQVRSLLYSVGRMTTVNQGPINWVALVILAFGGFFVTGASNALNQVLEKDFDRLMARTADRPLAAGRMTVAEGVLAAGIMSMVGIMLLALFNPWAAFFGMLAMVSYAFVYTPLKRISPIAISVGALPGALPTLIGCVAFQGELTTLAFLLFSIQFAWQFPHFMSIGWLGFDEYKKAGYKLIPLKNGERDPYTGIYAVLYALLLIPLTWGMYYFGWAGMISAIAGTVLALVYAYFGWGLYKTQNRKGALRLMFASFFYLPLTLILFYVDKVAW